MTVSETRAAATDEPDMVVQVRALVGWVGDGRKLTQAGRVTLADARVLVTLLGTGDRIDPVIGDRVFKTKSSEDLVELNLVVAWAKAARLLRVASGPATRRLRRSLGVRRPAQILADPAHEEHDDMLTWLGLNDAAQFDPASFDPAAVNRSLAAQ